ncbi:transglutaminase domain-containing protein [Nemorincola caseinilytica]|uniref:Transglutaminase domain-containing protein n=1 Tax=Nemorincola caseinilytica TaxID=2054315 RepID=A0ABP8NF76_9BACT
MRKYFLLAVIACASTYASAQSAGDQFAVFAREQNTQMVAAYEKRDVTAYLAQLSRLQNSYARLSAKDKAKYKDVMTDAYYNLACTYALTGDKKKALSYLERSRYYNYDLLLTDNDLAALETEPRFASYARTARAHSPNYVAILRSAPAYNMHEHKELPAFTYQPSAHPKLKKLVEKYDLYTKVLGGSDVATMINAMRWVHNTIKHDGSKGNPDTKNALSMLKTCTADGTTLNCRGMAIVLNEVYLAMGIPSRIVTCMPKDPNDNDCHVIVAAWSASLRKWVWMDPTFMAYVTDEKGVPLGIQEVRERLIQGRPLVLNPDANHNQYEMQTKEDYLYGYMAKNLYKLECPASSQYDYETMEKGKERTYIQLLGGTSSWPHGTSARRDGMNTLHTYFTASPRTFWKTPPGQSRTEQDHALAEFINHYNNLDDAAINASFADAADFEAKTGKPLWADGQSAGLMKTYGKIRSFRYMGVDEQGVSLYKVVCERSTHVLGLTLDGEGKFGTHRFHTTSPQIREMLVKNSR